MVLGEFWASWRFLAGKAALGRGKGRTGFGSRGDVDVFSGADGRVGARLEAVGKGLPVGWCGFSWRNGVAECAKGDGHLQLEK